MNLEKLYPWNWFKHEESAARSTIPVKRTALAGNEVAEAPFAYYPLTQLHQQIDRLFDDALGSFGFPALHRPWNGNEFFGHSVFQAKLNVASDDRNYRISLEAPGLTEQDVTLELDENTLIIRGEKKEDRETKDRHYYRIERSYGRFERVLALPDDSVADGINASMKNGVLDITIPRKDRPAREVRRIPVNV